MKQNKEPKKVPLFSKKKKKKKILHTFKICISCMVAMVTRIKYFENSTFSYIVMTPYFFKITCIYTTYL